MTLAIVPEPKPPQKRKGPAAKQLSCVESPATVLLIPVFIGETAGWWSYKGILVGGIRINEIPSDVEGPHAAKIGYLPQPVPRSWGERELDVVVEYEAESDNAEFLFRVFYGCGDPSELNMGTTKKIVGTPGGKQRHRIRLHDAYLNRNELLRVTLQIIRNDATPILIYGSWLEVGVD